MAAIKLQHQAPVGILSDPHRAAAVLHPIRLQILENLAEPNSAAGLARVIKLPRQKLNYHLHELEAHGFIELVEERQRGNATERIVRAKATSWLISPEVLGHLGADPDKVRDRFSLAYLVASAARVIRDLAVLRRKGDEQGKPVPTLTIQTEIRFTSPTARQQCADELANAIATIAAKYHDEHAANGRGHSLMCGLYPTVTDEGTKSQRVSTDTPTNPGTKSK